MKETIANFAYLKKHEDFRNSVDFKNVTYGLFPKPTIDQQDFKIRKEFLNALRGFGSEIDYNTSMAALLFIHWLAIVQNKAITPSQVFEQALKGLQVACQTNSIRFLEKPACEWLQTKWEFIDKKTTIYA